LLGTKPRDGVQIGGWRGRSHLEVGGHTGRKSPFCNLDVQTTNEVL
jgi:hypothetical protein